jgi:hypothetical protein
MCNYLSAFGVDMHKKNTSLLATMASKVAAVAAKIRSMARGRAPKGYEDETGFHFGEPRLKS